MADLDRLIQALENADKAGDTEAAALFADEIRSLQAGNTSEEPPRDVKAEYDQMGTMGKIGTAAADVARLANKGLTFGFGDKLSAGALSLLNGGSYEDELARQRGLTDDAKIRAGSAAMPAELTGAMVTGQGAANAGLSLMGAVPQSWPLIGRLLGSGAAGAVEGTAYGGLEALGNDRSVPEGQIDGSLFGAVGGASGELVSSLANWLGKRGKTPTPTAEELNQQVKAGYGRMQNSGVELRPEAVSQLNSELNQELVSSASGARRGSHPKIYGELDALADLTPSAKDPIMKSTRTTSASDVLSDTTTSVNGRTPTRRQVDQQGTRRADRSSATYDTRPDQGMGLYDFDEHRKAIRRSTKDDPVERLFGNRAISTMDDFADRLTAQDVRAGANVDVEDAIEDLKHTRKLSQREIKLRELDQDLGKANRRIAGSSNTNGTDVLRSKVRGILDNDKKAMGYSPDELQMLEEINKGTGFGNAMRATSRFANNMGGAALGGAGGAVVGNMLGAGQVGGGAAGILAMREGVGRGAAALAEKSTERQIEELLDLVARGGNAAGNKSPALVDEASRAQLQRLLMLLGLESNERNQAQK